ncbi:MAG: DUF2130 domain-containing protein [Gemmatales bacterium]
MSEAILCPKCSYPIEISSVLTTQLREQVREEFQEHAKHQEALLSSRENVLKNREREISQAQRALETELEQRLAHERERLKLEAATEAKDAISLEFKQLQSQLMETRKNLTESQTKELELRKDRRDLEEKKRALELTVARTIDDERSKIREEAKRQVDEEHRLKAADSEKLVDDLRRQIGELKRKAEQGSLQIQGEVLEVELENLLRDNFPYDVVEPIPVSKNGGDVLQHVVDQAGQRCGSILWEAKRTKSFNDCWLGKLREDLRAARGQVAVLVSMELPKGISTFAFIDGVWVTSRACLAGLATALRQGILDVARTHRLLEGRQGMADMLHQYFTGTEFRQRVEGIVEAFISLKEDLESEKRSMRRIWNKREKQLDRAVSNTTALYGGLGGILGPKMPQIAQLELAEIAREEDVAA